MIAGEDNPSNLNWDRPTTVPTIEDEHEVERHNRRCIATALLFNLLGTEVCPPSTLNVQFFQSLAIDRSVSCFFAAMEKIQLATII